VHGEVPPSGAHPLTVVQKQSRLRPFLVALALVGSACVVATRVPATSVVLITLDTTRADRLSPYGFRDAVMPALDRLAREGAVFDQATTVAPLTLPAHASLFTGLLPPRHGVRDNSSRSLSSDHVTLAEILRARGFRTAAFVGSTVLDPDRGLDQGFEVYRGVSSSRQRRADAVIDDAIRWLGGMSGAPFLLWAHLYDPHRPYEAPEPFASRHDPYVAEIAYADSQIARLLAALDERRLLDHVVVVLVGDHGESLGDHRETDHGVFLYESVLRVPFILRAPGLSPRRVTSLVRLTDVMPTILDLLGLPAPAIDGVSLINTMNGADPDLEAYAESLYPRHWGWAPLFALRSGRFKLIDAPRPELYDLARDPFEERNIVDDRPVLAKALRSRLRTLWGNGHLPTAPVVAVDLRARLAALGYVTGRFPASAERQQLPDPKDCAGTFESGRCR
jgi:choline-sulfatase